MNAPNSILAVIPARGGSKGLPGKNVRPLRGLPLIAHSIICAHQCASVSRVVVSTDSEEIAVVAAEYGAPVPFLRPPELASDTAAMWPVIQHALREMERIDGRQYDQVLLLDPTSPGRLPSDVAAAHAALSADAQCDGVIGVSEPEFNPYWHCVVQEGEYMRDLIPGAGGFARRQDLPHVFRINASLYLWRREHVLEADNWRSGRLRLHEIPESRAVHIDDASQFEHVALLLERGLLHFPWLT